MGIHDGHRLRMIERFAQHGLDNFDDVNVLELLLFYAKARCDTNITAHKLLERFLTLDGVFCATVEELERVEGVGRSTAVFLQLVPQVSRRYMSDKTHRKAVLSCSADAGDYCVPMFMYEKDELVYIICLNTRREVILSRCIAKGSVDAAEINIRKAVETALGCGAGAVILTHNHPGGVALPSKEDEFTTRRLSSALSLVGIELSDHIVVSGNDFVSMADSGVLRG